MKLSDSKHKLTCFVIMRLFPFYKNMLQFSGWSCSYKNGALLAKFQPGVLNPIVLICGCLPYPNHCWHTDYQLHKSIDSQTWYTFLSSNSYPFYKYTPDIPICHCVYEYLMSLKALTISFVFLWVRGPAHSENAQSHFLLRAYREQCVHL